jgi:cell wall-associated NlpC family hydrolase
MSFLAFLNIRIFNDSTHSTTQLILCHAPGTVFVFLLQTDPLVSIKMLYIGFCFLFSTCINSVDESMVLTTPDTTASIDKPVAAKIDTLIPEVEKPSAAQVIETGRTQPPELIAYAKTLIGVPYKYASTNPAVGFDCSGFITYVFNHFNITVPRSSIDFTHVGTEIEYSSAKPGDLILFTGTDSTIRTVGHMGIIVNNDNGQISFIHSTSGKANGVVITPFERYYKGRFVKVIRVFA